MARRTVFNQRAAAEREHADAVEVLDRVVRGKGAIAAVGRAAEARKVERGRNLLALFRDGSPPGEAEVAEALREIALDSLVASLTGQGTTTPALLFEMSAGAEKNAQSAVTAARRALATFHVSDDAA